MKLSLLVSDMLMLILLVLNEIMGGASIKVFKSVPAKEPRTKFLLDILQLKHFPGQPI